MAGALLAAAPMQSAPGGGPEGQQAGVFRSGAKMVPIYATVTDTQGALVPNLTREDFEILDNNVRQELVVFENQTQPITAIVMLDSSGSMTNSLKLVYAGAEQFLIRLLPQDKAQVGAFNDKVEFSGSFTSDRDELVAALRELDFGNPTRLYDAIDQSLDRLAAVEGRRVIVVLTDGEDNSSKVGQGDVLEPGAGRRGHDLRHRPGVGLLQRHAPGPDESRQGGAAAGGGNRGRVLPAEGDRRPEQPPSRASRRNCTASTCSASAPPCWTARCTS